MSNAATTDGSADDDVDEESIIMMKWLKRAFMEKLQSRICNHSQNGKDVPPIINLLSYSAQHYDHSITMITKS
jgi:hypothetical protein